MKKFIYKLYFNKLTYFSFFVLLIFVSCTGSGGIPLKPKKNSITHVTKKSLDSLVQISRKNLNTISRYGAGVFLTAGNEGVILTTVNGGRNWTTRNSGITDTLLGSAVLNYNIMIVAGKKGTILRSTNKGITWGSVSSGTTKDIKSLSFINNTTGYASGEGGLILKTTNSGVNWNDISLTDIISLNSISFIDSSGWAAANDGLVYRTTDAGANWTQDSLPGTNNNMNSISFSSITRGTVVGDSGRVFETYDGGANWILESAGMTNNFKGVHRVYERLAYIVGESVIIRDDNGTKTTLLNNPSYVFNAVDQSFQHPTPYFDGIVVGSGSGVITSVNAPGCNDCNVKHKLIFYQVTVDGQDCWRVSLRIDRSGSFINLLRVITPGYQINTVLNDWTQTDNVGDPGAPNTRIVNQSTGSGLNDYVDIDLQTQLEIGGNPDFIQFDIVLSGISGSSPSSGSVQFYFSSTNFNDAGASLTSDFCLFVTYYITQ